MKIKSTKMQLLMAEKSITQTKLATTAGVSRATVNGALAKGSCSVVTVGKLAKALGVEPMEIISEGE